MVPGRTLEEARATVRPALPLIGKELRKLYAEVLKAPVPDELSTLARKLRDSSARQ